MAESSHFAVDLGALKQPSGKVLTVFALAADLDVAALFAEAIMNRTPWALWDIATGKPAEVRENPLVREVYFYTNRKAGERMNPLVAEYLRVTGDLDLASGGDLFFAQKDQKPRQRPFLVSLTDLDDAGRALAIRAATSRAGSIVRPTRAISAPASAIARASSAWEHFAAFRDQDARIGEANAAIIAWCRARGLVTAEPLADFVADGAAMRTVDLNCSVTAHRLLPGRGGTESDLRVPGTYPTVQIRV